jgi:hypothetical protein
MSKAQLQSEIRYTIRLCQRTARLYRRAQTFGTFLVIVGGSATLTGALGHFPAYITVMGGSLLAVAGAALISIRAADKAAQNESDVKRYQALMAKSMGMPDEALRLAIEEARQVDAVEVEPLRNVAFNDVMEEINRKDQLIDLSFREQLLKTLA